MRQVLRGALPTALAGVLLAGCSAGVVVGEGSPEPVDVARAAFPVTGVSDTGTDQLARNALTDLNTFWSQAYPEFFGGDFTPLENGYFSVDSDAIDVSAYPETGIGCDGSRTDPADVAGNAFYDPACDLIAYDRALLEELSTDYGRLLAPVVMAHEFGHAMQGRFGFAANGRSIQDETQADCFAGAWTGWVAAATFANDTEYAGHGNAAFDDIVSWVGATLPEFWSGVFPTAFDRDFTAPSVKGFDGTAPDCAGVRDRDLGYCADTATVYLDQTDLATPAYDGIGDFALTTALSLPYSLAVRDQAGLSVDDGAATRSAVCLTGWYEAQWYSGAFIASTGAGISPGDIDEAVQFLLEYGVRSEVFPNTSASGFELVGAFRTGFLEGGDACGLGH
jgi:hypothetical protein